MATAISQMTALASIATGDHFPVVDVSDATQSVNGTTKRTTFATLSAAVIASDAELAALAGLTSAADRLPYFTGSGAASLATFTAGGRALVNSAGTANTFPYFSALNTVTLGSITAAGLAMNAAADAAAQKTLLSLNNVENTALSTWAGSANVTTLGTIGTGTWNATTISVAKGGTGLTTLGTAGQALVVNAGATGLEYATIGGGGSVATDAIWDAAGDLAVGSGANTAARLAIGTDGQVLGVVAGAVAWTTLAGGGDVSKVGTPANNQMPVWTGDGTLEGTSDFTYDGTSLNLITGKNFQIAGGTVLADAGGTLTLSGIDALDATTEATIEAAIDTLANLTSIQNRTVTLADAGADALFGWDDSASAYQNLSAADARTALGLSALATTVPGTGIATFLESPTSANLRAAVTDENGDGALMFEYAAVTLSTATNLVRGTHGNRLLVCDTAATHTVEDDTTGGWSAGDTLYGLNTSAGNVVLQGDGTATVTAEIGATLTVPAGRAWALQRTAANAWRGGAADSIDLTAEVTGTLPVANGGTGITSLGTGVATFLGTPSSANLAAAVTGETGSGALVFGTAPTFPTTITVGAAAGATGQILMVGTTSGTVTLKTADAAGTYTLTLPTTDGDANQVLTTDGAGVLSWSTVGGSGSVATDAIWDAASDLAVGSGANTAARLAMGTALQVLRVNAGATALEWAAAGNGDVTKVGTPTATRLGIWTGDGTLGDDANLSFNTTGDLLTVGAGSLTRVGAHSLTLTTGATTDVTFPASGTLATLAGTETLTNKTLTSPTLTTPALGTPASGNLSSCTADGTNSVGFLGMPQNSQSADYTTVLADAGKHILHPTADNNARTFTIDSNANVAYPIGTTLTFINQINTVTIAITSDTLTLAGAGTTGSRTLAANGIATAIKVGTTSWVINGSGLT